LSKPRDHAKVPVRHSNRHRLASLNTSYGLCSILGACRAIDLLSGTVPG